jgi:hypothetical protein
VINYLDLALNPFGHFGFTPLIFLIFFPFIHEITFWVGFTDSAIIKLAVAETGASVDVPGWVAVTEQFPPLSRLRVEPVVEQFSGVEVENKIPPPLDAVAERARVLLSILIGDGSEKVIV